MDTQETPSQLEKKKKREEEDKNWYDQNHWSQTECNMPSEPTAKGVAFGPKHISPEAASSQLGIFMLFFSDFLDNSIIPLLQQKAAERAQARHQHTAPSTTPSHHKRPNFTHSTFLCFLSVAIVMGFAPAPREQDYWKRGDDLEGKSNFMKDDEL